MSSASFADQTRSQRIRLLLLGFVVIVTITALYYVGVKGPGRSAFCRWQPYLPQLLAGENIYTQLRFATPPIMGLLLYPLALLPMAVGMTAWLLIKAGLTALAFHWIVADVERRTRPIPPGLLAFAALLSLRPVLGDLMHGNINLWILFLIVGTIHAFLNGHDRLAGWTLALATACKVTPALLIVYFAWKRRWILVGHTLLGLIAWLVLVPGLILGFDHNRTLLATWGQHLIVPYVVHGRVDTEQVNQSLPGLLHRLTTDSVAIEARGESPAVRLNFLRWSPTAARRLTQTASLLILLTLAWLTRHRLHRDDPRWLIEMSLVLIAMLWLSERSWKHHYVTLMVVHVALVGVADLMGPGRRRWVWSLLLANQVAMLLTSPDVVGTAAAKLCQAYGAYLWGSAALVAALIVSARSLVKSTSPLSKAPAESVAQSGSVTQVHALSAFRQPIGEVS